MPKATFVQEGNQIDHTPSADVAAGDVVVQGELVGIAKTPIAANALGALSVTGVADFPKATGATTAIAAGAKVHWDEVNQQATTVEAAGVNKYIGKAIAAASDDDATVRVRLDQ
jgi:predicted RecA/RadA family phage recombinase